LNLNGVTASSIRGNSAVNGNAQPYAYPFPSVANGYPPPQPGANTPSMYRLDPANLNRGLLTPYSWALDWPGLSPNFQNLTTGTALALNPGTILTGGVLNSPTAGLPFPSPPAPGTITDFSGPTQLNNSRAALGPIDLNRPLADYRPSTSTATTGPNFPLSPTNMAPSTIPFGTSNTLVSQAVIDRQQFAMSIFVRLVVASGAQASYQVISGVGESIYFPAGSTPVVGSTQFNALQALAQLAANIVDYIDSDDVSTAFVWNPINANDPLNPANFANLVNSPNVVFGVEKPRLVLNEAFGEITNNPNDPALNNPVPPQGNSPKASQNPYVRFWLELQNPTSTPYAPGGAGPLGTGSVKVRYTAATDGVAANYSPYLIQIVRSSSVATVNVSDVLRNPASTFGSNPGNVTGAIVGATPDLIFDFSAADGVANNATLYSVNPANPTNAAPNSAGSILVCAPAPTTPPTVTPPAPDWNPTPAGSTTWTATFPTANVITGAAPVAGATNSLTYTNNNITLATAINAAGVLQLGLNQNVILLRRLANPYLLPNDPTITTGPFAYNAASPINPYITVDYMDYVPATDQIFMLNNSQTKRTPGAESATSYPSTPASLGKVQPYTGWTATNLATPDTTLGTYKFTFPNSLVLPQTANPTPNQTPGGTSVLNTFGYVNSATPTLPPATQTYIASTGMTSASLNGTGKPETIMTPVDWLPHLDRQLLNQTELLQVSMGRPHEYTLRSIVPNALAGGANDVSKFGYTAAATINSTTSPNMLYRALDVLRIQPYGQMTALGGRVPGRININTIQDKRVWDALYDAQSWNGFTQTDVTNMWTQMIGTRTPSVLQATNQRYSPSGVALTDTSGSTYVTPVPGQSVYDTTAGTGDRPFLPFNGGSGLLTDTLVRGGTLVTLPNAGPHPYQQSEALRKIMNNTTTVSHTFAVWVTVGYFDYNAPTPGATPVLGAEYYSVVPGDLRRKYFSVVDRSMVGLDPSSVLTATPTVPPVQSQNLPFFTTVDGTSVNAAGSTTIVITTSGTGNGVVNSNGVAVNIMSQTPTGGSSIAIGTGATQEIVLVTKVSQYPPPNPMPPSPPATTGVTLLTLSAALKYPHWPGESVSNVIPGNPGPQSSFNYLQTPYSYVVPFWSRLQ
jgi:hypothetical protein